MMLLAAEDPDKDIWLYINSPGGSITAGMAIYDTMQYIQPDVATIAMGMAASMGQFLLSSGTQGKRYATPHARVMMHQPSGGIGGTATDVRINAQLIMHMKKVLAELTAEQTGKPSSRSTGRRPRPLVHRSRGPRVRLHRPRRDERFVGRGWRRHDEPAARRPRSPSDTPPEEKTREYRVSVHLHRAAPCGPPAAESPVPTARRRPATCSRSSRSARPTASSARTRTPSSSRTASSSSACRSTTPRPTTSWPSCWCSRAPDPDRDIILYINSPGGSFTALTAIYDTMQYVKPHIQTVCLGQAASAAAVLLAAGSPGKRLALPNARVLIHQPAMEGGGYAQASDIEIHANEIIRMREWLEDTLALHSGRDGRAGPRGHRARQDPHRASRRMEYGLVDQVLASRKRVVRRTCPEHRLACPWRPARGALLTHAARRWCPMRVGGRRPVAQAARHPRCADEHRSTGGDRGRASTWLGSGTAPIC